MKETERGTNNRTKKKRTAYSHYGKQMTAGNKEYRTYFME